MSVHTFQKLSDITQVLNQISRHYYIENLIQMEVLRVSANQVKAAFLQVFYAVLIQVQALATFCGFAKGLVHPVFRLIVPGIMIDATQIKYSFPARITGKKRDRKIVKSCVPIIRNKGLDSIA